MFCYCSFTDSFVVFRSQTLYSKSPLQHLRMNLRRFGHRKKLYLEVSYIAPHPAIPPCIAPGAIWFFVADLGDIREGAKPGSISGWGAIYETSRYHIIFSMSRNVVDSFADAIQWCCLNIVYGQNTSKKSAKLYKQNSCWTLISAFYGILKKNK